MSTKLDILTKVCQAIRNDPYLALSIITPNNIKPLLSRNRFADSSIAITIQDDYVAVTEDFLSVSYTEKPLLNFFEWKAFHQDCSMTTEKIMKAIYQKRGEAGKDIVLTVGEVLQIFEQESQPFFEELGEPFQSVLSENLWELYKN